MTLRHARDHRQHWPRVWAVRAAEYGDNQLEDRVHGWSASWGPEQEEGQTEGPDLIPDGSTRDQWIGDEDRHPRGVVVGAPTGDPGLSGMQGALIERTGASDGAGGVALVGVRQELAARSVPDPGTLANAPVEISGTLVLLMGQPMVEVPAPITGRDRYLLLGESALLPDGRHVCPLLIGPEYVPSFSESVTSTADVDLDDAGTLAVILTLGPLANAYEADVSQFSMDVRISEEGGRTAAFDIEIWHQPSGGSYAQVISISESLNGGHLDVSRTIPVQLGLAAGDSLQMRVASTGTHQHADGWVRGSQFTSKLEMRQG